MQFAAQVMPVEIDLVHTNRNICMCVCVWVTALYSTCRWRTVGAFIAFRLRCLYYDCIYVYVCVCVCECIGVNRWQKRSFMVLRHIRTQWVVCECIWLTPDCAIEMLWCQCNNKNNRISDKCADSSIQCVCAYVFLSLLTASPVCVCQQQQEKCECQAKEYAFYEARKCKIRKNAKSRVAINVQLHCGTRICLHIHTHTYVSMHARMKLS